MLLSAVRMTSVSIQAAGYKEGSIRQLCRVAGYSTRSPKFKLRPPPRYLGFRRVGSRLVEHLFSRHVCVGEGAVKSLGPSSRDRAGPPHTFPQNSENFFYSRQRRRGNHDGESAAKNCREIQGGGRSDADRHRAGVNRSGRLGKVRNDERSDWQAAWALFPGSIAYAGM
jgi:hypothetical protein